MATLTSTKIKNTYDALLKASDNDALGSSAKQITDGLGNATPLYISTTQIGIGVTPESGLNLHVYGDAKIGSNLTVIGNLVVEGSTTTVGTDTLTVKDPLIVLANNNTSTDAVDIGFYGKYTPSGTTLYSGLFREALTGKYRLFKDLQEEPTTTVNTSGTGYTVATLIASLEGNVTGDLTGDVTGNLTGNVTGGTISGTTGTFSGNVDIDGTLDVDDVISVEGSGFGRIEIGGASGGYIDLKAPNSDDYDLRLITSTGGAELLSIDTLKFYTGSGTDLAITIDASQDVTFEGNIILSGTVDGRDVSTDGSKLDGIEAGADVTDTANVRSAGALMDDELTNISAVKAINQQLTTTSNVQFTSVTSDLTGDVTGNADTATKIASITNSNIVQLTDTQTLTNKTIDADNNTISDLEVDNLKAGVLDTDLTSVSASDDTLASAKAIKTYVDSQVGANNELSEVLANGNTTGGTDISVSSGDDITFADSSKSIYGAGNDLQIYSDGTVGYIKGDDARLVNASGENIFRVNGDVAELYYNDSKKLETTSTGVTVTGGGTFTGDVNVGANTNATRKIELSGGRAVYEYDTTKGTSGAIVIQGSANKEIHFETTADTPDMIIDSSGNVGIGTDSPDTKLEIVGNNPILTIRDSDTSSSTATSTIRFAESNASDTLGNYWDVGYSPVNLLNFDFNGSTKITINSSGNVGIGTTSPDSKLDVTGGDITVNTTGTGFMNFKYSGSQMGTIGTDGVDLKITANADLQLLPASNVGINTASPEEKLHVIGSTLISNNEFYKVENTSGTNYKIAGLTNGNEVQIGAIDYTTAGTIFAGGDNISITTGGASGTSRIKIDSSGNVGIGTTSPASLLHIKSTATTPQGITVEGGDESFIKLLTGGVKNWGFITTNLAASDFGIYQSNANGGDPFTAGTAKLYFDGSGNATFAGSVTSPNFIVSDGTNNYIQFDLNGKNSHFTNQSKSFIWSGQGASGDYLAGTLNFQSRSSADRDINFITGATPAKRLTISGLGNVGINNTNPTYKLDVAMTSGNHIARFAHSVSTGYAPASILLQASQSSSRGQGMYYYNTEADENWFVGIPYNVSSKKWVVANKYSTNVEIDTAQLTHALLTVDSDTGNVDITGGGILKGMSHLELLNSGGSDGTATSPRLYSPASGTLAFSGNGSERMRIDSSGGVGVNTTSITNYGSTYGNLDVSGTDGGYLTLIATNNAVKVDIAADTNAGYVGTKTGHPLIIRTDDVERMRIDSSGNVTIGNSTYGSSLGQLRIINDAASSPASLSLFGYNNVADGGNYASIDLAMQTSGTGGNVVASIKGLAEGTGENASNLAFYTKPASGLIEERMRIKSNGDIQFTSNSHTPYIQLVNSGRTQGNPGYSFNNDENTGMFQPAGVADTIAFSTGGSERMRIQSNGNVAIGNTNSDYGLLVEGTFAASNTGSCPDGCIYAFTTASSQVNINVNTGVGVITPQSRFHIGQSATIGSNFTTAVNNSQLFVHKVGTNSDSNVIFAGGNTASSGGTGALSFGQNGQGYSHWVFYHKPISTNQSSVGSISSTSTATAYNTSSDYRLKENVVEMTDALDRVSQLKPSRFNFIEDADKTVDGFLAHEVQDIVPEAITGEKDAVDGEGNAIYQGIDQAKLVPLLVGAIQELKAEIEQLKTQINN